MSCLEIEFNLQEHGWLDIFVFEKEQELHIPVSYLSDSIREMIVSLSIFLEKNQDIIFKFQTEPGEYRFKLSAVDEQICLFEIYEFKDSFSKDELEEGLCIISTRIKTNRLVNKIYREILKMGKVGNEEFKNRWRYDFPQDAFDRLTRARKIKRE